MRLIATALVAAASLATVAQAEVSGPRVEAVIGYDRAQVEGIHGVDGFAFGLGLGYDFAVGNGLALGLDIEATESTSEFYEMEAGRDLYVGGRITGKVTEKVSLVGKVGYSNARVSFEAIDGYEGYGFNLDGLRLAAGAQYALGEKAYVGAEYRYTNYEADFNRHQVVGTLGYRF